MAHSRIAIGIKKAVIGSLREDVQSLKNIHTVGNSKPKNWLFNMLKRIFNMFNFFKKSKVKGLSVGRTLSKDNITYAIGVLEKHEDLTRKYPWGDKQKYGDEQLAQTLDVIAVLKDIQNQPKPKAPKKPPTSSVTKEMLFDEIRIGNNGKLVAHFVQPAPILGSEPSMDL